MRLAASDAGMQQMTPRLDRKVATTSPRFFANRAAWRRWLSANHAKQTEILLGLHKRHTDVSAMTYQDALDEALCFGWIDGVRRRIDEDRWSIRFSPRKERSIWSAINLKRFAELQREGRVAAPGLAMFEARTKERSGVYSYENRPREFEPAYERKFRASKKAWQFFEAQPPGYRRTLVWFVMSAKQEATRQRRLDQLIAESATGRRMEWMKKK
jgi:uncharacterized protein YdeI (YjbR/CyaY-like superfamily)